MMNPVFVTQTIMHITQVKVHTAMFITLEDAESMQRTRFLHQQIYMA